MTKLFSKLALKFYTRNDVLVVARDLLGKRLVVLDDKGGRVSGLIVETEAYMGPEDRASHAYGNRRTARTEIMFARGGLAYVYFVYGMHHQFNVVAGEEGSPLAVLVRALQPEEGIERMRERRGCTKDQNLTSGPGKLCEAMGINRGHNGADLRGDRIWIEDNKQRVPPGDIASGPRVGIDYAKDYIDKPWRFWIKGNTNVSGKRRDAGK